MMVLNQIRGTIANSGQTIASISLLDLLPPSIVSTLLWIRDTVPRGLGFADRTGHITGVVALTIVLIISSFGLLTVFAIGFFGVAFPLALLRVVPFVNDNWPLSESAWPLWSVGGA